MSLTGSDGVNGTVDVSLDVNALPRLLERADLVRLYVRSLHAAVSPGESADRDGSETSRLRQLAELQRFGLVDTVGSTEDDLLFEGYDLSVPVEIDGETVELTPEFALVYARRREREPLSVFVDDEGPAALAELVSAVERHAAGDTTVRQIAGRLGVDRARAGPLVGAVYDTLELNDDASGGSDGNDGTRGGDDRGGEQMDATTRERVLSSAGIRD